MATLIASSSLLLAAPKIAPRSSSKLYLNGGLLPISSSPRSSQTKYGEASLSIARLWRVSAAVEEAPPLTSETIVEKAQQAIPAAAEDSTGSTIVSALLFVAFIALSLLTIGECSTFLSIATDALKVTYLAVQDFLQKRETEKFEKEEAEKKKKKNGGKKSKAKARAAPRGFGQKVEEDED